VKKARIIYFQGKREYSFFSVFFSEVKKETARESRLDKKGQILVEHFEEAIGVLQ